MTTLTRGALLVGVIAELLHQRPDPRQDALYLRRVSFFPFLLLRRALDDARGLRGKRCAAPPDGFVEWQLEPLEHFAKHLDRAVEDVLVAEPNPLCRRDLPRRVEGKTVRRLPLVCTHFFERCIVVVAPAGRQQECPLLECTAIDVDRTWKRPEHLAQREMSVVEPAVHERAHVVAPVAVDIDET